jgi:cytochrome b561
MPRWQAIGARGGHALLYLLLFAVPLSGWLFDSASSLRPLFWWGVLKMPNLTGGPDKALAHAFASWHEWLFWTLVVVAAGHATIALVHHFIVRDEVLRRMLPTWRGRTSAAASIDGRSDNPRPSI